MKPRRLVPALVVLALCGSAFAAVALAGSKPNVKGSKKEAGPYVKSDLMPVSVASGPRDVFVKVISRAQNADDVLLYEHAGGDAEDFSFKWFKGDKNITHDVQTSGHEFKLQPDKPRIFRIRIKEAVPDPGDVCVYPGVDDGSGEAFGVYFGVNGNLCN